MGLKSKRTESSPKIILDTLTPDDLPRILELEELCFSEPWQPNDFEILFARGEAILLAARTTDHGLVGYSCAWAVLDAAELGNIAVAPDFQGWGIGKALLKKNITICKRKKVEKIYLEVRESNFRAVGLYNNFGFEVIGRRKGYYAKPREDAIIMRLDLL